jgi:hypothetical protein
VRGAGRGDAFGVALATLGGVLDRAALTGDLREDPKSLLFKQREQAPSPWLER